jgi:hypothetical protein
MSESEETKWRLDGVEPEEAEEKAAELSSEDDEKKEELQQSVQTKAEEIGGGGEGSLITRPEEVPITEAPQKNERIVKTKRPTVKREPDYGTNIAKISKQLERQANQLTRIEKVILPLQRSVNRIDKQSNTIKQIYSKVIQLQRQIRSTKSGKQNQGSQKKKSLKGRQ